MHVPPTLLIPDCRQEPLNNSLSLAEIQQRNSLIWKMCLILCVENFKQIRVQGDTPRSQYFGREGDARHGSRTPFRGTELTGWTTPRDSTTNRANLERKRTPPSLIRSGVTPHSSLTEASKDSNHSSSRRPSHQSALWSILTLEVAVKDCQKETQPGDVTSIELGDLNSENDAFKNSHKFSAMVSRFWSGTIRTDSCDFTREGITVGSRDVQRIYPQTKEGEQPTPRPRHLDVVDGE